MVRLRTAAYTMDPRIDWESRRSVLPEHTLLARIVLQAFVDITHVDKQKICREAEQWLFGRPPYDNLDHIFHISRCCNHLGCRVKDVQKTALRLKRLALGEFEILGKRKGRRQPLTILEDCLVPTEEACSYSHALQ